MNASDMTLPESEELTQAVCAAGALLDEPRRTPSIWFLSGQLNNSEQVRHLPLHCSPFTIGRRNDSHLCLPYPTVSGTHAEIIEDGEVLLLRDLQSTNGTYVNGNRIQSTTVLREDDLVQFAELPFRVRRQSATGGDQTQHEDVCDQALALVQFDKLMSERAVTPNYQPIVDMVTQRFVGYEVLGRSRVFGLETPDAMFHAASQLDLQVELSRMFRWEGIRASASLPKPPHLFVNTHPAELVAPGLVESMVAVRDVSPSQPITLEIHEAAITDPLSMARLRAALTDLNIGLAYDDFGAGQNRLVELIEVRPDYLKFDMSLVRGIHTASLARQQMIATLVRMVRDLGIVPLAEGIEASGEHRTCLQLGFQLGQGFYYGRPAPVRAFSKASIA